jgi:hypothetical protein
MNVWFTQKYEWCILCLKINAVSVRVELLTERVPFLEFSAHLLSFSPLNYSSRVDQQSHHM